MEWGWDGEGLSSPPPSLPFLLSYHTQVQNGTLTIQQVERVSAGVYTCQATNTEGSVIHTTQLLVSGKGQEGPIRDTLTAPQREPWVQNPWPSQGCTGKE